MKITIEIDSGAKIGKYSEIFNEIVLTLDTLGRSGEVVKYVGVKRVDDGHGSWQLMSTITFISPFSKSDKREEKVESYLDTEQTGWLRRWIIDQARLFIATRITEAQNNYTNLQSYRIVDPLI